MSSFDRLQRKRSTNSTRTTSTSRWLQPSRQFAPLPTDSSEQAHPPTQEHPERTAYLGHSFERIALLSPEKKNTTGLPDTLKTGIEHLSGISLDDVHVHYNSTKPSQVKALAYTQGTDIQVGPEQENYLAHEAWHAVQQKQKRVRPTLWSKGLAINDDQELEREAGDIAKKITSPGESQNPVSGDRPLERPASAGNVIQLGNGKKEKKTKKREKKPRVAMKGGKAKKQKAVEETTIDIDANTQTMIENPANYTLGQIAGAIHTIAGGSPNANTTGVGRLNDGTLVLATQLSRNNKKLRLIAQEFNINDANIYKTINAGYHTETTLYIKHNNLVAVGASQGFCPDCQKFLAAKHITADGNNRATEDQVWYSPEYYSKQEKNPINAAYPWAFLKDPITQERVEYKTMAEYQLVEAARLKGIVKTPEEILAEYSNEYLNVNGSAKKDPYKQGSIAKLE